MCIKLGVWAVVALTATAVWADDKPNPDQLKKAYDDALVQLREAQNSKNELARENDRLKGQVEDLKKQLAELGRRVAGNDEKTFQLRSFYAAWQAFLQIHPDLLVRWQRYLGDDALAVPQRTVPLLDLDFPIVDNDSLNGRG
jgi:hypothetical protein